MKVKSLSVALTLALAAMAAVVSVTPVASAAAERTYLILYMEQALPSDATATVRAAAGTVVASYPQIGVVVARSSNDAFAATLERDPLIYGVAPTARLAVRPAWLDIHGAADAARNDTADPLVAADDTLSDRQWDMDQIHAPEAHEIQAGSRTVVVGDIDTGLDFTHPDIAPNYDAANSADCTSGTPTALLPGNDRNGHGTHTAGTIAAAEDGIGIVGVAPNVKIAGIKSSNDDGFFFPEMVVCSFMWAGTHGIDVTNNSYFADPWYFNCKNDPGQRAIWIAEQRAIRFAMQRGTVVVAASGNFRDDLAHPTRDVISPDFPPGSEQARTITNACAVIPVEVPGVVGVNANGNQEIKSFYSNYGLGVSDVIAPGGDSLFFTQSPTVPNGRVLSTWPAAILADCPRPVVEAGRTYCYLQGTSMASPHVTGVAALIRSQFPGMSGGAVAGRLFNTADPMACPTAEEMERYEAFPSVSNGEPQVCTGGAGYNSFNGHGQVNALAAVGG